MSTKTPQNLWIHQKHKKVRGPKITFPPDRKNHLLYIKGSGTARSSFLAEVTFMGSYL